jgi:extradiol dioxygenase family protein
VRPFHLAFPVDDLDAARSFYGEVLGCRTGRESPGHWIDFDFFGHQLTAHYRPGHQGVADGGLVDADVAPIPHFGVILTLDDWKAMAARLEARSDVVWGLKPKVRFAGTPGEQATLFIFDPSGNGLEFKAMSNDDAAFSA